MHSSWMDGGGGPDRGTNLLIGLVVVVAILYLRNRKPRPLKIERLWIRPAIFLGLMAASLTSSPPPLDAISLALIVVATIIGAGLGWQRGRFMLIDVHPETDQLTTRVSPIGLLFLVAIVIARLGLRAGVASASRLHLSFAALSDATVTLLGAMMVAQSTEIWLRARRVLAEARSARVRAFVRSR
jgi:amino acid transporter